MPNHIQSIITISGTKESVERVKNRILVTEEYISELNERNKNLADDFKTVIPKLGTLTMNRLIPKPTNIFQGEFLTKATEDKYGKENCWFDWNIQHWGTKWDVYDEEITMLNDNVMQIMFQTAWHAPMPYMEQLAKVCVEEGCKMSGMFCDEDFASNMGLYIINENNEFDVEWHSEDATLYEECWGWNPCENDEEFDDVDDESVE